MPDGQKSIFITGVGSGIGKATALLFAKRGWLVAGYDVNQDGLHRAAIRGHQRHLRTP